MKDEHVRAVSYLAKTCEVMADLTQRYTPVTLEPHPPEKFFQILVSSIIGQQLAVKAAATIEARLVEYLSELSPEAVLEASVEDLRNQGLSRSKASYIIGLAEAFQSGQLSAADLAAAAPEEVIQRLVAIKGIGPWTAEMFLIFGLGLPDVWSPGDYGLTKAVQAHFGAGSNSSEIASRWRPYRSYAALYLWEYVDQGA